MPVSSNFLGFAVTYESSPGVMSSVGGGVDVIASDGSSDIDTFTTDSNGLIAAGSLAAAIGTQIFFRVENFLGRAMSVSQITT